MIRYILAGAGLGAVAYIVRWYGPWLLAWGYAALRGSPL